MRKSLMSVVAAMATFIPEGVNALDLPKELQTIETVSTIDGLRQNAYWYAPPDATAAKPVPLLVHLHTWSYTYANADMRSVKGAIANGWAVICPNFRGPNSKPDACGSDKVVQDVLDAVAEAKRRTSIDESRIYLIGSSGGGHLALLMAGRAPKIWAGVSAWCPISDLARWHAESTARKSRYFKMMEKTCGGAPAEKMDEYRRRSPLTYLASARDAGVHVDIATGIHDGHTGSVPVGQAIRAFNVLADDGDRISEADISFIEAKQAVPPHLAPVEKEDPWYGKRNSKLYLRRTSANARLTLFEGGHNCCAEAGVAWLGEQRLGAGVTWKMPTPRPKKAVDEAAAVAK